jgi:hypothetical protein
MAKIGGHFTGSHAAVQEPFGAFFEVICIRVRNGKRWYSFFRALGERSREQCERQYCKHKDANCAAESGKGHRGLTTWQVWLRRESRSKQKRGDRASKDHFGK